MIVKGKQINIVLIFVFLLLASAGFAQSLQHSTISGGGVGEGDLGIRVLGTGYQEIGVSGDGYSGTRIFGNGNQESRIEVAV